MFEAKSEEVRRFFDLLGSIFLGILFGVVIAKDIFRYTFSDRVFVSIVFSLIPLIYYVTFHYLVWRFVNSKFLFGYFNFILISIPSLTLSILTAVLGEKLFRGMPISPTTNFSFSIFMFSVFSPHTLFVYSIGNLPMAFFWFIGVLTAWKFSKKRVLQ